MSVTDELKQEHRIIERMLAILEAAATRSDTGQELPNEFFPKVVDFIRNFADRCHHGKEEDYLFPVMEKCGVPRQVGPIGVMLMEHDQARTYVKGMDEAGRRFVSGDKTALKEAIENARRYAALLRRCNVN